MPVASRPTTERVFRYLVGTYRRVEEIDSVGFVVLVFRIRAGPLKGMHAVGIDRISSVG